jgi:hypothetical protein
MSNGPTNSTAVANLASLIAMEAQYVSQNRQNLANAIYTSVLPAGSNSVRLNKEGVVVATEVPDGDQIQLSKPVFTAVTFTPSPKAASAQLITDLAAYVSGRGNMSIITGMVDAVLTKQNKDILAAAATFTNSKGTAGTTELTLDVFEEAHSILGDKNASEEKYAIFTFGAWRQLVADLKTNGGDVLSDSAKDQLMRGTISESTVGSILGFVPLVVPSAVAGSTNFAYFFEKRALAMVYTELFDVRVGEYDTLRRGNLASIRSVYHVDKYFDEFGIKWALK